MSINSPHSSSPLTFIRSFVIALASITVTVGGAACESGEFDDQADNASYELASRIAQSEGDICEAFNYSPAADSDADADATTQDETKKGEASKCGEDSETDTYYEVPSQPIDTGESNKERAQELCAKWAIEHGKIYKGFNAPKCPGCPDGSSGCEVTDAHSHPTDVRLIGSTYSCTGQKSIAIYYTCSKCLLDGCKDEKVDSSLEIGKML